MMERMTSGMDVCPPKIGPHVHENGLHADGRGSDGHAGQSVFGDGHVHDPLGAEVVDQSQGGAEHAPGVVHAFADDEGLEIVGEDHGVRLAQGLHIGQAAVSALFEAADVVVADAH